MHHVRRHVDDRAGLRLDLPVADLGAEGSFENVDPLLVRVRMRHRAGAGGHAHERHDHAVAFDAAALDRGIVWTALDVIDLGEIEHVLARPGPLGARRPGHGFGWGIRHRHLPRYGPG